ncbi:MAG: hypothetical protein KA807_20450 [Prolixibacteraceae bacterium]|nr:hypothetical protein [Prolixibacteraceae bacterium]
MRDYAVNRIFKAASLFGYFEKVKELGNPDETNCLLSKPTTTFENWVQLKVI